MPYRWPMMSAKGVLRGQILLLGANGSTDLEDGLQAWRDELESPPAERSFRAPALPDGLRFEHFAGVLVDALGGSPPWRRAWMRVGGREVWPLPSPEIPLAQALRDAPRSPVRVFRGFETWLEDPAVRSRLRDFLQGLRPDDLPPLVFLLDLADRPELTRALRQARAAGHGGYSYEFNNCLIALPTPRSST